MKKILFLLVGLMLFLSACGGDDNSSQAKKPTSQNDNDDKQTEISNKVFENEDYKFVFGESEQIKGKRGNQVLKIDVEFTNKNDKAQSAWMALSVALSTDEVTEATTESIIGAIGGLSNEPKITMDTKINTGKTVDTVLAFELQHPGAKVKIADGEFTGEKTFKKVIETSK